MATEAQRGYEGDSIDYTPTAAVAAGEVLQIWDGRAAFAPSAIAAGVKGAVSVCGIRELIKTTSVVILQGDPIYWDISAGTCTPLKAVGTGDFFVGVAMADAAAAATAVLVAFNVQPQYLIDIHRDGFEHLLVKTVVGSTTVLMPILESYGGAYRMAFGLTAEAQKLDLLSKNSVPKAVPFIVEGRCAVYDIGDAAALDFNIGIANGTHASDADAITESVFIHMDGTSLNLLVESDDGTTENAAADSTLDAVDDTYFDFRIDCRDLAAIKFYINGVRVMDGVTGAAKTLALGAATGPFKLLAHLEKSADDTPGDVRVSHLAVRTFDIAV